MDSHPKILVVDDTPQVVEFYSLLLRRMGCVPIVASNGEDALKYLGNAQEPFSLIMLDLLMPGMTGWEILQQIRKSPTYAETPVVVVTGMALPEDQKERLLKYCQRIMVKTDFNLPDIRRMIAELLDPAGKSPPNSAGKQANTG